MTAISDQERRVRTIRLSARGSLALRGATVLDGRGGTTPRATVVIEGERIAAVDAKRAPDGAADSQSIDLTGRWIFPGLVDGHLHLATGARPRRTPDHFEQRDEGIALLRTSLEYGRMLLSGVTTIRSLGGEPYEAATAIRRAMLDEFLEGPRVLTAGTAVIMPRAGRPADRLVAAIKTARRNFGFLADVVMLGSCQLRSRPPFSERELRELVDEAHRRRIRIAIRPLTQAEGIAAARAGVDSIEGLPRDAGRRLFTAMRESGTSLTPLLAASTRAPKGAELTAMAHEEGISIVAGSDWSLDRPDASLGRELEALRDVGLDATELLASATWRAADALGLGDSIGTVESGKLADLVVLRSDPRKDPSVLGNADHVEMVIRAGDPLTS